MTPAPPYLPESRAFRTKDEAVGVRAAYEHPWAVRMTHWAASVSLVVLMMSGLQIFWAFPSFGQKIPQENLFVPPDWVMLGGWLAGGIRWHVTFAWIFVATGAFYVGYQLVSGRYRMVLFTPKDVPGVWPMVKHYFLFGPKPPLVEPYNALQKLAYTTAVALGAISVLTGIVLFNPVQFSPLTTAVGGFSRARLWHFLAMCGFLAFIPGHLIMVALHGWGNFVSMVVGWKAQGASVDPR